MKKLAIMILSLLAVFALVGCTEETSEPAKTVDKSAVEIYSMDLSDIAGYETYVVAEGTWAETYDVIINLAKREPDAAKRTALYHEAE